MEKTVNYTSIESVTYKFTKSEVRDSLIQTSGIKLPLNPKIDFDLGEDAYEDHRGDAVPECPTTLVVRYASSEVKS